MRLVSLVIHVLVFAVAYFVFSPPVELFLRGNELLSVLVSSGVYILASFVVGIIFAVVVVGGGALIGGLLGNKDGLVIGSCLGILLAFPLLVWIDKEVIMALPGYLSYAPQFTNLQAWGIALVTTLMSMFTFSGNSNKSST